jgi:hypothetical protein
MNSLLKAESFWMLVFTLLGAAGIDLILAMDVIGHLTGLSMIIVGRIGVV